MEKKEFVNIPLNGKDQWWLLSIDTEHISINQCMSPSKLSDHKFFNYIHDLAGKINGMKLYAEPLIDVNCPNGIYTLTNLRGHKEDPDPFLYRKKRIPMIRAEIYYYWTNNNTEEPTVLFRCPYHSAYGGLTDGMKSFLHQNFDGLTKYYTKDTMDYLVDQAIKNAIFRMRAKLDDLEKDIEIFKKKLNNYWIDNKLK